MREDHSLPSKRSSPTRNHQSPTREDPSPPRKSSQPTRGDPHSQRENIPATERKIPARQDHSPREKITAHERKHHGQRGNVTANAKSSPPVRERSSTSATIQVRPKMEQATILDQALKVQLRHIQNIRKERTVQRGSLINEKRTATEMTLVTMKTSRADDGVIEEDDATAKRNGHQPGQTL